MTRHASTCRERLADHPLRAAIVAAVQGAPGILQSELRRRLGCSAGTIQYHLKLLEGSGVLVCLRSNRRHRVFPPTVHAADRDAVALLASWRVRELARALLMRPGATRRELAAGLPLNPRALREHLGRLQRGGLVSVAGPSGGDDPTFLPSTRLARLLLGGVGPLAPGDAAVAPIAISLVATGDGAEPVGSPDAAPPPAPMVQMPALSVSSPSSAGGPCP